MNVGTDFGTATAVTNPYRACYRRQLAKEPVTLQNGHNLAEVSHLPSRSKAPLDRSVYPYPRVLPARRSAKVPSRAGSPCLELR